ncbi:hypothetical protein CsatB_007496 [Cannabis sativa]
MDTMNSTAKTDCVEGFHLDPANMNTSRGKEELTEGTRVEKVETFDYQTPPGEEGKEPTKKGVQVIHLTRKEPNAASCGGGDGILAGAAAAVSKTLESAKGMISGTAQDKTRK